MKKLLTFLTLLTLSIGVSWAGEETVTFSEQGYSNEQTISSYEGSNFTITFYKGNNSNAPKYYNTGSAIRIYGGNYFIVSSEKTIKSMTLTFANYGSNTISSDVGSYNENSALTNGSWTGSASSIKFTVGGTSGHRRLQSVSIIYEESSQSSVGTPSISFNSFTAGDTEVTATIEPGENATSTSYKIGDNGSWQTYSAPIDFDLTQVASPIKVYAKSSDGTNESSETYSTFTLPALGVSISPSSYSGYAAQTVTITPSNYVGDYAITYTINDGTATDYTAPFTLSNPGTYEIVATVLDERAGGTAVTSSTATITINEAEGVSLPFVETFANAAGDGPSGDSWSGSTASAAFNSDNEGWTYNNGYAGEGCARFGKSGTNGYATTPLIIGFIANNDYTLTFKAGAWNNDGTTLSLTASNGIFKDTDGNTITSVTMLNNAWTDYEVIFVPSASTSTITFTSNKNRFFLDEVNVNEVVEAGDGYYLYGTFNSWNTKDANYKFTEDNGNYVLNDVDLPANVRFKISKVENGQVTEYGGSGNSDYGIHRDWHTHIDMNGVQAYTIAGAALTNFILHPNADINNMYFEVERVPQLYFKCDKINNWANNPMSQINGVWTYSRELEAGAKFGFNDEWGDHHGYNWTVNPEHYGNAYDIPVGTADTYTMRDAGNYKLDVNSNLTVLHVNKVFNINCSANPNGGGTVVAKVNDQTVTSAMSGETVTIEYTTNSGYSFNNITLNGTALEPVEGVYSFVMTTQDAEVVANFTASSYDINVVSVPDEFGTVTCPSTATTGQTVTFTITPDDGYEVKSVTAYFVNGDNNTSVTVSYNEDTEEYSFGMPPFPVIVTVTYKVPLAPCTIPFVETWKDTDGDGGNDGTWSGISTTSPIVNDNEGWIYMRDGVYVEDFSGYGADACIRLGDGSHTGSATTPEIIVTNGTIYKMTFKAGSWDSDVEALLSATGAELYSDEDCTIPISSLELPYRSWGAEGEQEHVVYVKATSSLMTITWSTTAAKKRFFLDEVNIREFAEAPAPEGDWKLVTDEEYFYEDLYEYIIVDNGHTKAVGAYSNGTFAALDCDGNVTFGPENLTATVNEDSDVKVFYVEFDEEDEDIIYLKDAEGTYYSFGENVGTTKSPVYIDFDYDSNVVSLKGSEDGNSLAYNGTDNFGMSANSNILIYYRTKPLTLAEVVGYNMYGEDVTITDELAAVKCLEIGGDAYLWCKDLGFAFDKTENPDPENIEDYMIANHFFNGDWDQSTWIALKFEDVNLDELGTIQGYEGKHIKPGTLKGKYTGYEDLEHTLLMETINLETIEGQSFPEYTPNLYCPANFLYANQKGDATGHGDYSDKHYFFVNPKTEEFCEITFAVWNGTYFVLPAPDGKNNITDIYGAFYVDWSYNSYGDQGDVTASLDETQAYKFKAIVKKQSMLAKAPSAKDGETVSPQTWPNMKPDDYLVYPIDFKPENSIVTRIENIVAGNGEVKSVKYVNVAGIVSDRPFQGVNIVVTEYTDGSRTTTKMLRK